MSLGLLIRTHLPLGIVSSLLALTMFLFVLPKIFLWETALVRSFHPFLYIGFALLGGVLVWYAARFARGWHGTLGLVLLGAYPAVVILLVGFAVSRQFHYLFNIALVGYAVLAVVWFAVLRQAASRRRRGPEHVLFPQDWFRRQGAFAWVFLVGVFGAYAFFALHGITRFAAVDEPLWLFQRIPKTFHNLEDLNWHGTAVSDKPGATVAYVAGLGYALGENPKAYEPKKGPGRTDTPTRPIEPLYAAFRTPVAVFTAFSLLFFYFLAERLFGRSTALLATAFIGTAPLLIGISRIVNPDSLLWVFAPLSVMAFLFYQKSRSFWALLAAGVLLGLALLTKYVANLLFVFFLGLLVAEYWFRSPAEVRRGAADYVRRAALDFWLLILFALATILVLYPYAWVKPAVLLRATLLSQAFESVWPWFVGLLVLVFLDYRFRDGRTLDALLGFLGRFRSRIIGATSLVFAAAIVFVLVNVWSGMAWVDFEAVLASPKTAFDSEGFFGVFISNFYPLVFGLSPLALACFSVSLGFLWWHRRSADWSMRVRWYLLLFIFFYYLGSTVNEVVAIARYQIMVYPLAYLIAALGALDVARFVVRRRPSLVFLARPVGVLVLAVLLVSLVLVQPHYQAYASVLLPKQYQLDIKDMGTGSYEAAEYLNSLPGAEQLSIWTDKSGVCAFFHGAACHNSFNFDVLANAGIDYVVVSSGRASRTDNMLYYPLRSRKPQPNIIRFDRYYDVPAEEALWTFEIDGRSGNFVKIIPFRTEWTGDASRFE